MNNISGQNNNFSFSKYRKKFGVGSLVIGSLGILTLIALKYKKDKKINTKSEEEIPKSKVQEEINTESEFFEKEIPEPEIKEEEIKLIQEYKDLLNKITTCFESIDFRTYSYFNMDRSEAAEQNNKVIEHIKEIKKLSDEFNNKFNNINELLISDKFKIEIIKIKNNFSYSLYNENLFHPYHSFTKEKEYDTYKDFIHNNIEISKLKKNISLHMLFLLDEIYIKQKPFLDKKDYFFYLTFFNEITKEDIKKIVDINKLKEYIKKNKVSNYNETIIDRLIFSQIKQDFTLIPRKLALNFNLDPQLIKPDSIFNKIEEDLLKKFELNL